ncbi:sulfatase [Flavivirga spongiicola]|uniref:Sulfatase n=1 Tax=Flavivirga spongiicola TaxID=421621 RepID=A0ABU7XYL3_9FLAO|nr:sulfatase [Flavivirga sp. MEBiC05379]MDO5980026.1 sulfatase [Flavivirga sp. MEBiC05379]
MIKLINRLLLLTGIVAIVSCGKKIIEKQIVERPNFLCITFEDASPYGLSCYGNPDFKTHTIDSLAKRGILYTNAFSTAPHCSPARSTLITGSFATTYGMDVHREDYETPQHIFYSEILRKHGYFCTNNTKTDYNTILNDKSFWDECGVNATYWSKQRKPNQPFFAVFNASATHMGRMRTIITKDRGRYKKMGINPETIQLPNYVPDLPDVRSDLAVHLESYKGVDLWLRTFLNDLKQRGLAENTIIFFYSDHGGCLPRGKGFPFESGLKVPYIVHVPEKWQKIYGIKQSIIEDRLIGFEDFAPTVLNLAGIEIPGFMQGHPFLGPESDKEKQYQFGFRTNQENYHYDPSRTVRDGKYKYIRNYIPHKPFALRNLYQWGMPANLAWDNYVLSGACNNETWLQPFKPKTSEMLFDLDKDPNELNNLADNPIYSNKLIELRTAVSKHIRETKDLGFFFRGGRKKEEGLYKWVRKTNFPLEEMYDAAEKASMPTLRDIPYLTKLLSNKHADIRYWGAVGFNTLASRGDIKEVPLVLKNVVKDSVIQVSTMAAEALCYISEDDKALSLLFERFKNNDNTAYSALETLTWYPKQKKRVATLAGKLENLLAENEKNKDDRMSIYLKIRSLMVNIGKLPVKDLYPESHKEKGRLLNIKSRQFQYPEGVILYE